MSVFRVGRLEVDFRRELLRNVWEYPDGTKTRTVDMYVTKLRKKIEPEPGRPRVLTTVRGEGYRLSAG